MGIYGLGIATRAQQRFSRRHSREGPYRAARREVLRLLLEDIQASREASTYGRGWSQERSATGVLSALKLMRRDDPRRCARLLAHVRTGRLRDCAPEIQAQVDGALDWMSDRLPFPLVAPEAVLDDLREWADWMHFDESSWLVAHLAAETRRLAEEILSFSGEEDQRYVRDDDGEYTDGRRAGRLSEDSPGWTGRFASIGIDPVADAFMENGPRHGYSGSRAPERWRTREKRQQRRPRYAPAEAGSAITAATGMSLDALRASLDRGRPTEERRAVRVALARVVWDLRSADRVRADAVADALACDPATIWRLAQQGRLENARSPRIEGEGNASLSAAA